MDARRLADAASHLRRADPVLGAIVERVGPCTLEFPRRPAPFRALARAIVFQQLSGKAAETIHGRFAALFGGRPSPAGVLAAADATLRGAGLSRGKVAALRDLAAAAGDGRLPRRFPPTMTDDAVTDALVRVRGIGPWTAQMFLLFHLGRPDVWPIGDLGVRTAVRRAYALRREPTPARLERLAAPWRPFRSVATWYLWRSLDAPPTDPTTPRSSG